MSNRGIASNGSGYALASALALEEEDDGWPGRSISCARPTAPTTTRRRRKRTPSSPMSSAARPAASISAVSGSPSRSPPKSASCRSRCACSARIWCCSAAAPANGGCSTSIAATGEPRSNTASSSPGASAAATTAGCSRRTAGSSRPPASRRRRRSRTGSITAPTRSRSMTGWSSPIWDRPTNGPISRPTTRWPCRTTGWCPTTSPIPATGSRCRKT